MCLTDSSTTSFVLDFVLLAEEGQELIRLLPNLDARARHGAEQSDGALVIWVSGTLTGQGHGDGVGGRDGGVDGAERGRIGAAGFQLGLCRLNEGDRLAEVLSGIAAMDPSDLSDRGHSGRILIP